MTAKGGPISRERSLAAAEAMLSRWLEAPDLDALAAVLAAVIANRSSGDPVWLLIVGPPSSGKTELIMALAGLEDVQLVGRMTLPALLSGTAKKERAPDATGGVLRLLGEHGILVNKDFGSVLAMQHDSRAELLQVLRDVYDGRYDRPVGADGGRSLHWRGRCGFIAGCTPAIDNHHGVIAALGDRYLMLRLTLGDPDKQAERALTGNGSEAGMRREFLETVTNVVGRQPGAIALHAPDAAERGWLARLASLAARCRSIVDRDRYGRDIINVPPPEQPARIAKQLGRLHGGLLILGCDAGRARRIVERVALDSMPTGRRAMLEQLVKSAGPLETAAVGHAVNLPASSTRRHLEDLAAHHLVNRNGDRQGERHTWQLSPWTRERWPDLSREIGPP